MSCLDNDTSNFDFSDVNVEDFDDDPTPVCIPRSLLDDSGKRKRTPTPRNNDGRRSCYWCGELTTKKLGLNLFYDFCERCQK